MISVLCSHALDKLGFILVLKNQFLCVLSSCVHQKSVSSLNPRSRKENVKLHCGAVSFYLLLRITRLRVLLLGQHPFALLHQILSEGPLMARVDVWFD